MNKDKILDNKTEPFHNRVIIYIDVKRNEVRIANQTGKLEHFKNYDSRWELSKIIQKFILVGANLDKLDE